MHGRLGLLAAGLGRQLPRAGTSIVANMEEADAGRSKPDFISKVAVSRKEARETGYWLRLLAHADPRLHKNTAPLLDEARQLVAILTSITLNAEANLKRERTEWPPDSSFGIRH